MGMISAGANPIPRSFKLAARRTGLRLEDCVVIEDALAGVEAALAGGARVLGVGAVCRRTPAHAARPSLEGMTAREFLALFATDPLSALGSKDCLECLIPGMAWYGKWLGTEVWKTMWVAAQSQEYLSRL